MQTSFDGSPDRLALFLGQVIDHLDKYGHLYNSQWAMIMAVAAVMEGEAADWVTDLYSNHAGELGDIGLFLSAITAGYSSRLCWGRHIQFSTAAFYIHAGHLH